VPNSTSLRRYQSQALADLEHLQEQIFQLIEMRATKLRNPRVVWMVPCC